MSTTDPRKRTVYFPDDMIDQIQREADRTGLSLAEVVRRAWDIAKPEIRRRGDFYEQASRREEGYGNCLPPNDYFSS